MHYGVITYQRIADLPAQYFEPTANDIRATQAALTARAAALRDEPLLTQKLREEKQKERLKRFPNVCFSLILLFRQQLAYVVWPYIFNL